MIFNERQSVIFRDNGEGDPKEGTVIYAHNGFPEFYIVDLTRPDGTHHYIEAKEHELTKKEKE